MPRVVQFASLPQANNGAPRILLLKVDHRGDFVTSLPALKMLRDLLPRAHLTLVVSSWNEEMARGRKWADAVLVYDLFQPDGNRVENAPDLRSLLPGQIIYDMAIDLRVDADTRFLLADVPSRIKCGFSSLWENSFLDLKFNYPDFAQGSRELAIQTVNYEVISSGRTRLYRWEAPLLQRDRLNFETTSILARGFGQAPLHDRSLALRLRSATVAPLRLRLDVTLWNEQKQIGGFSREINHRLPFIPREYRWPVTLESEPSTEAVRMRIEIECLNGSGWLKLFDIPWFDPEGRATLAYEQSHLHRSEQYTAFIGACVQRLHRDPTTYGTSAA